MNQFLGGDNRVQILLESLFIFNSRGDVISKADTYLLLQQSLSVVARIYNRDWTDSMEGSVSLCMCGPVSFTAAVTVLVKKGPDTCTFGRPGAENRF